MKEKWNLTEIFSGICKMEFSKMFLITKFEEFLFRFWFNNLIYGDYTNSFCLEGLCQCLQFVSSNMLNNDFCFMFNFSGEMH